MADLPSLSKSGKPRVVCGAMTDEGSTGEETWNAARLIPTSGINGTEEQERRATSALLAVMSAVREFGRAIVGPLGAPSAVLETFIEVPFVLGDRRIFPDGLVRARRGQRTWTGLVEVKTGNNALGTEQLEDYLDVAREHGFDALITISNEIPALPNQHPTSVDKRKLRRVTLHHLSWTEVLTEAVMQKEHRGVADPEQAWILGELVRYLEHPRSGALAFDDMGPSWVPVREAVAARTLRASDKAAAEIANRFDALLRYASLRLGRQLGVEVIPALTRKEISDPASRNAALVTEVISSGTLSGGIKIPDTVAPIQVTADLRAGCVTCHLDLDAPREGRATTRVNWLTRQLKGAPETLRIEAFALHARGAGTAELLRDVRVDPASLVADPKRELRAFRVTHSGPLGSKRGTGRGGFIDSVVDAVEQFYEHTVQHLKAWSPAPPRLRQLDEVQQPPDTPVALVSTALSSQDGPDEVPIPRPAVSELAGSDLEQQSTKM